MKRILRYIVLITICVTGVKANAQYSTYSQMPGARTFPVKDPAGFQLDLNYLSCGVDIIFASHQYSSVSESFGRAQGWQHPLLSYQGYYYWAKQYTMGLTTDNFKTYPLFTDASSPMGYGNGSTATGSFSWLNTSMATIAGGTVQDIVYYQIQVNTGDATNLSIPLTFASEEYSRPGGANNDVVGLFVDPVGSMSHTNYAMLPGTSTPISASNTGSGSGYYTNTSNYWGFRFDGCSPRIPVYVPVAPSTDYTITIAVANKGDGLYNSAVFFNQICSYTGPTTCVVNDISITNITCTPDNDDYFDISGTIDYTLPPASGNLVVSSGGITQNISSPFSSGSNFSLSNVPKSAGTLTSKGYRFLLEVDFSASTTCKSTREYYVQPSCEDCSITLNGSAGTCDPNTNQYTVSGNVIFSQAINGGTLILTDGNSYKEYKFPLTTELTKTQSPFTYNFEGLFADGQSKTITAKFSENPDCFDELVISSPSSCYTPYVETDVCENCIGSFSPMQDKKYVISAWVSKEEFANQYPLEGPEIIIEFLTGGVVTSTLPAFTPEGQIIDGWQKIEEVFEVPSIVDQIRVKLNNTDTTEAAYFDDIRIFPNDGSMKSYVYDPVTLRLVAELDANNYATRYEYDNEGGLIRVKKETERGIVTIQENRNFKSQK